MPARAAAPTWSRIRASSGETSRVGPAPRARSSAVATKYIADFPHPVRWTTSTRSRRCTRPSIASSCPSRKSASARPTRARSAALASSASGVVIPVNLRDATDSGGAR